MMPTRSNLVLTGISQRPLCHPYEASDTAFPAASFRLPPWRRSRAALYSPRTTGTTFRTGGKPSVVTLGS